MYSIICIANYYLVEAGFISNSSDLQILKNEQTSIAARIFYGIRKWWWGY